jgi:hypothetical protein
MSIADDVLMLVLEQDGEVTKVWQTGSAGYGVQLLDDEPWDRYLIRQ